MPKPAPPHPATLAAQALGFIDAETKAIVPPIHTATTYIRDPDNKYRSGRIYSRDDLGATDGGSSGSPVVNASNQVVGQLSGACGFNVGDPCDAVNNATVDGAFAFYFSLIKPFINP